MKLSKPVRDAVDAGLAMWWQAKRDAPCGVELVALTHRWQSGNTRTKVLASLTDESKARELTLAVLAAGGKVDAMSLDETLRRQDAAREGNR